MHIQDPIKRTCLDQIASKSHQKSTQGVAHEIYKKNPQKHNTLNITFWPINPHFENGFEGEKHKL